MVVNILLFLLFPWVFGVWLFKRDKTIFLRMFPFGMAVAIVIDLWGQYHNYWILKPVLKKRQYLTTMPLNFGLYPILSALVCYIIKNSKERPSSWILVFTCLLTVIEFTSKIFGFAAYRNGWNLMKTFLAYLVALHLVYRYYVWRC
ncbi:hypothetical protein SAMN05216352_104152 [Alteribacillus bidgolensis]|uniref:Uncharacterized protein n=1 Tax=Alteribacillus bidgolensis TaxID=930129 RepID=A0A1G8H899_9BACI|nr:hypothetical protein [Alteribacillus bidgolensis]SDI02898.1 hypothetical protein SAMN05216352_104152 [Alteribacillus bidgolensis]